MRPIITPLILLSLATVTGAFAQESAPGQLQRIVVHGASLEGNLVGLSPDRAVTVYLPPSYAGSTRRYPVVYVLHGIMDSPRTWTEPWGPPNPPHPGFATMQDLMDRGIASRTLQEMILVIPDADKTCHYTDSPVKGGWASFIARDLVQYVDRTYRTISDSSARGIMGHSMGGHGALKLAMRFAGVFSAVYVMNPSMLGWGGDLSVANPQLAEIGKLAGLEDLARAGFYTQAMVGIGQCFSPNPGAPLLTDPPFAAGPNGTVTTTAAEQRWSAQMPVFMARTHVSQLKALRGLRFDSAFEDEFSHIPVTSRAFSTELDSLGVPHTFEMYNGDHRNRLWGESGRIHTIALPYFSRILSAEISTGKASPPGAARQEAPPGPGMKDAQDRLWSAARSGDIKRAEEALTGGADVNALDTLSAESGGAASGRRALNYAALHNRAAMVRWLVEHGADVNRANKSGFTPLHHAAEKGAVNSVEELLTLGADPNATLPSGSTALRVARQRRFADVARILEKVTTNP